ncbi:hypothetical protein HDZ31DRAFT_68424, partial [Schizophyllum fasciatum]
GWTTQDDGVSLPDDLTKIVNTKVGLDGHYDLSDIDNAHALTWTSKAAGKSQWFLAIDEANDVHC